MKINISIKKCLFTLSILLYGCSRSAEVPTQFSEENELPCTYPEVNGVMVPVNIAPLTFSVLTECDDCIACFSAGGKQFCLRGTSIIPEADDWETLKQAALNSDNKRSTITVDVYTEHEGKWKHYLPMPIYVSADSIDPYISYRLISPSYVTYEGLTINQRCLENYDESLIYSNMLNTNEKDGQCINCHSYQNYDPERMQFHVRQHKGGTVISYNGKIEKVDLKQDGMVSAGVYPAWHPTLPLIAYSTNKTGQTFHTYDRQKIEVQDCYSDLVLYDVEHQTVEPLVRDTNDLDCFPFWDAEGRYLYYCSAHYELKDSTLDKEMDLIMHYTDVHYNLYRRAFDPKNHKFGAREMVYDCADTASATLPRISPDGRWLLFTRGDFGVFHIWHRSADLYLMSLCDSTVRRVDELNSPDVESYHSWSSNGKWVIFSSRRHDGNFTRPFIAHFDSKTGNFDRPFELPQADPLYHLEFLRSYNIPEFMRGPVTIRPQEFASIIAGDSIKAKLSQNMSVDAHSGASKRLGKNANK